MSYTFRTGSFLGAASAAAAGNRLLGALAGARIGLGALAVHRQVGTMAQAALRADLDQALDVHLNLTAQIALDLVIFGNVLADRGYFRFAQVFDARVRVHLGACQDLVRTRQADPK